MAFGGEGVRKQSPVRAERTPQRKVVYGEENSSKSNWRDCFEDSGKLGLCHAGVPNSAADHRISFERREGIQRSTQRLLAGTLSCVCVTRFGKRRGWASSRLQRGNLEALRRTPKLQETKATLIVCQCSGYVSNEPLPETLLHENLC